MLLAEKELGEKEIFGNQDNERIVEYGESVELEIDSEQVPWCATFVNFILQKAGYKGTKSAAARSFSSYGRELKRPKYGAIIVFQRGNSDWQGHVGFYVSETSNYYRILGGNQGNSVSIKKYPKRKMLSIRWPEK